LLVYDVQSKKTFENAKHLWLRELRDSADEDSGLLSCVMLVGNKIDLEKNADNIETFVGEKEHTAACNELSLLSNRTSAKTGQGVEKAFKDLIISEFYRCSSNWLQHRLTVHIVPT
jgi:Ras-related protein Rab-11A